MKSNISNVFEGVVVVLTALGLWSKKDTKAILDRVAIETTTVANYLLDGKRANSAHGRLEKLIDEIASKGGHRHLHMVGYSFGSIVTLDTLYPRDSAPAGVALQEVDTLVTVGCPFDFIRTFWPAHFDRRTVIDGVPYKWINIFDPNDVLGSNFADSVKGVDQPRGVRSQNTQQYLPVNIAHDKREAGEGLWAWVQLAGFRAHGHYWEHGDVFDKNCYRVIVGELAGRPAESAAAQQAG